MELYLLRHGYSLANAANLVTGGKADTLCPEGRDQARGASGLLRRYGLDSDGTICFVSDWERARETATLAAPNLAFNVDSRLGETDAGAAAGMTLAAFAETHPCFWSEWDPDCPYPEGESHRQLYERVISWRKEMEKIFASDAKILAVTHAGPICCLLHAACKVDMTHFPMFLAANASLTKLERVETNSWRLAFFSLAPELAI